MRYLVISDIHGNWEALDSVLRAAAVDAVDQVLVLGDLVGYGAARCGPLDRLAPEVAEDAREGALGASQEEGEGRNHPIERV